MSKINHFFIFFLILINTSILQSIENEIIFKISNKPFTSIDLENRREYLLFVGDNSSLTEEEIIQDFISVSLFEKFYLNTNNKRELNNTVDKVYKDIISINSEDINFNINSFSKENIYKNLKLDLIRKLTLEDLLNGRENNILINNNDNNDIIYNYNIHYINIKLNDLKENKEEFLNTKFNNLIDLENYLKKKGTIYLKKYNKLNNLEKVNKIIKNKIYLNNNFFKIQIDENITFFNIEKNFQTHDSLSLILYSFKSKKKLNYNDIKCNYLEEKNIESKEYEFEKLNNNIKRNLININDFVEINNEDSFVYVILCGLNFNKDLINNLILNKKLSKLVDDLENNFVEKYSDKYNLIITNE